MIPYRFATMSEICDQVVVERPDGAMAEGWALAFASARFDPQQRLIWRPRDRAAIPRGEGRRVAGMVPRRIIVKLGHLVSSISAKVTLANFMAWFAFGTPA